MGATPNVNVGGESTEEYFANFLAQALQNIYGRQNIDSEELPDPITIEQMARRVIKEIPVGFNLPIPMLVGQMARRVAEQHTVPQTQVAIIPRKKLVFSNPSLPRIYTENEVLDVNGLQLKLNLVDINYERGDPIMPIMDDRPLDVELFVLKGDFGPTGTWTSEEFDSNIVEQRKDKGPLLVGTVHVMLKHGMAIIEDIKFTDNSSWTWSKTFKIGAKVVATGINDDLSGVVLEAVTEAFRVTERRMKSMAKHYPLKLDDKVWRLEKIRKDGPFHKRLQEAKIYTVKDILDLSATPDGKGKLRGILVCMPDKWLEAMLQHAWKESGNCWEEILARIGDELR